MKKKLLFFIFTISSHLVSFKFSTLTVTLINTKKKLRILNSLLETPSLNENSKRDENATLFASFHTNNVTAQPITKRRMGGKVRHSRVK